MSYCQFAPTSPVHASYHEAEYGFPQSEDNILFERLILEINQAGLSWETILKKREGFHRAYDNFDLVKVANYGQEDRERLLADPGIIRNRLKVEAAIHNAGEILKLTESHGSFANWLDAHHPLEKADWVKLFKKQFRFTGGEIVGEFLMSLGYLKGAHEESCPVYKTVMELRPAWAQVGQE